MSIIVEIRQKKDHMMGGYNKMLKKSLCSLIVLITTAFSYAAENPTFEKDIAPILQNKCISCHNASTQKGELDLSTPFGLFKGGESQSTLVSGDLEASYLYELVHSEMMPPDGEGEPLTEEEVHTIGTWIENKTPFADGTDPATYIAASEVNQHDIQPIMLLRCTVCHGNRRREGGLDLRTKATMLKGGKSGPAIVLGKPEESLIIKRMAAEEMPPRDKLLPSGVKVMPGNEVEMLKRWIELGAPEVEVAPDVATVRGDPLVSVEDRQHWSFMKPVRPDLPTIESGEVYNPIDMFVIQKQHEAGLEMSPEASRVVLIRRVYFDLTGLPPSPEEVELFVNDSSPNAYELMIERV
ncbi:MAG: c-type cytochrome domain-containing protein, partial [Planctomycetota bacterium]|nr:c-type cytochrome domain-containing protein [Planctomycetota bacterium]